MRGKPRIYEASESMHVAKRESMHMAKRKPTHAVKWACVGAGFTRHGLCRESFMRGKPRIYERY